MYFLTLMERFHCQSISKHLYFACVLVCTFSRDFFPENQAQVECHHAHMKLMLYLSFNPHLMSGNCSQQETKSYHRLLNIHFLNIYLSILPFSSLLSLSFFFFFSWTSHLKMKYLISMPPVFSH